MEKGQKGVLGEALAPRASSRAKVESMITFCFDSGSNDYLMINDLSAARKVASHVDQLTSAATATASSSSSRPPLVLQQQQQYKNHP